MNKENLTEKIRKTSKLGIILIPLFIIGTFATGFMEAIDSFKAGWNSSQTGEDIGLNYLGGTFGLITGGITAIALFATAIYIIINIYRLLIWFSKSESPFERKFIKELHDIGIGFILFTVLRSLLIVLHTSSLETGGFLSFSSGILFYILSMIFRYGSELQRESDETL